MTEKETNLVFDIICTVKEALGGYSDKSKHTLLKEINQKCEELILSSSGDKNAD